MRRNPFGLQGLILVVVCLICVRAALAQAPPSSIQLFMPNGSAPTRAIRLTVVTDRGQTDTVYTDSKGVYMMRTPANQSIYYTVTIEADRETFDTTTTTFKLDRNSPARIVVFVKPLPAIKRPAKGDAILDIANYEANIPPKARAAYKRALDSINDNHLEGAISDLQKAIDLYPTYVAALNDLGVTYMKLRRLEESETVFRKAIEIDKRFFHPRMNLGIVLNKEGKYKEAQEILEPLYGENHGMLELRLGQIYYAEKKFAASQRAFEQYLSDVPAAPNAPQISQLIAQLKTASKED